MGLSTRSRTAFYLSVFLSCVSFAIVLPSVWPYMATLNSEKSFLAWVVASYSVGEAFGAVALGCVTDSCSTSVAMMAATALGAIGSILYVSADAFPEGGFGLWLIFVGRFIQGMWTGGAQAIQTAYLAGVLPVADLTPTIVTLRAYASLGFILGPVFGLILNLIPFLSENSLTAPGYFVLVSAVCMGILFLTVFDEEADRASVREGRILPRSSRGSCIQAEQEPLISEPGKEYSIGEAECSKDKYTSGEVENSGERHDIGALLMLCNLIIFVLFSGFAVQETITTPFVETYYNWTVMSANLLFLGAGLCALLSFVAVRVLSRLFSDREMMAWSLSVGIIGCVLLTSTPARPLPAWRFMLGFFVISVAFPVGRGVAMSLYTKLLPLKLQGPGQGVILAVGAVARILGPFWAVCAFYFKFGGLLVFGVSAALFALCLSLVVIHYPRLRT